MPKIKNLGDFKQKETYMLLYERVIYIEKLIAQINAIRNLPVEVINYLSGYKVHVFDLIRTHTELVYVLYRSMFQGASWEVGFSQKSKIEPSAYFTDEELKLYENIFDDVCEHVDKVLAHQDNVSNLITQGVNPPKRGVYPAKPIIEGQEHYVTWNWLKRHAHELSPSLLLMKKAIKTVDYKKFKEQLPLPMI